MQTDTREILAEQSLMTAGGTETYLFFQQGFALRDFCAFEIFDHPDQLAKLETNYLFPLFSAVADNGHGLLLDAMLWRAHPDFVAALGYSPSDIVRINERAAEMTRSSVAKWRRQSAVDETEFAVLIAADIGPRGDGYRVDDGIPSIASAHEYHQHQMQALAAANIDVICAWTMTNANEAAGIVRAAASLDLPVIVSPTVETDGRLPDGSTLADFIAKVDDASPVAPIYYMVNCAHPAHLAPTLRAAAEDGHGWLDRFKGFRANASIKSHAELDNSTELDRGDPQALAKEVAELREAYDLRVVGGCCGTDHEHIAAIAAATGPGPAPSVLAGNQATA